MVIGAVVLVAVAAAVLLLVVHAHKRVAHEANGQADYELYDYAKRKPTGKICSYLIFTCFLEVYSTLNVLQYF